MDETREVNVGNKVVKPIHHSGDLKKPKDTSFNFEVTSKIWTIFSKQMKELLSENYERQVHSE